MDDGCVTREKREGRWKLERFCLLAAFDLHGACCIRKADDQQPCDARSVCVQLGDMERQLARYSSLLSMPHSI